MLFDKLNADMVKAMLEAMPAELTVIDANDEVAGWNKHETRLFRRPMTALGMNFRQCHPAHSLELVERLVGEMKAGTRDKATFWIDMEVVKGEHKHKMFIEFYALRDEKGNYLGCMEFTQDVQAIRELQGQRRLMD